jgi:hypothetical protein
MYKALGSTSTTAKKKKHYSEKRSINMTRCQGNLWYKER